MEHGTETHVILLPPDGFGSESDNLEIFKIRLFLMGGDGDETKLPPLYTQPGDIDAVESFCCNCMKVLVCTGM
jgi:hypothetical protein